MEVKMFVKIYVARAFASDHYDKEIGHRDPTKMELTGNEYAFEFFDEVSQEIEYCGEKIVTAEITNRSKVYYPGADVFTRDEVAALPGDYKTLLANMDGNKWDQVIRNRCGQFWPKTDKEIVI